MKTKIKYVKTANMWCTTSGIGKQQETKYWKTEKEARDYAKSTRK